MIIQYILYFYDICLFIRYSDLIYDAFANMVESENFYDLTKNIENWSQKIFSIHQTKFYFIEEEFLVYYNHITKYLLNNIEIYI